PPSSTMPAWPNRRPNAMPAWPNPRPKPKPAFGEPGAESEAALCGAVRGGVPVPRVVVVVAFMAAAMDVIPLANDCGLVSAWRLRSSGLDTGVGAGLALLPCPAGILGLPLRIALLD